MVDKVQQLKQLGNDAFASKGYEKAESYYSQALQLDNLNAVLFSNRALCYLRLENYSAALSDCDQGLAKVDEDKTKVKLLYRKANALKGTGDLHQSKLYLEKTLELDPNNQAARNELANLATSIPIERVDALPRDFQELMEQDIDEPASINIKEVENKDVLSKEIDEMFASRPKKKEPKVEGLFVDRSTTFSLSMLKSIPEAQKDKAYIFLINLPPHELVDTFTYGIEPEFLSFYFEAAAYVSSNNSINDWQTKILLTLQALSKVKRYDVAKVFIEDFNIQALLTNISTSAPLLLDNYKALI